MHNSIQMKKNTNGIDKKKVILDIKELDDVIRDYMSKISEVNDENLKGKISPEDYIKAFREDAFGMEEHNFLEKNDEGILCYDLMICQNPLEEEKKQRFYTFFSLKDVYAKKKLLANVYQYYLDNHPDYHIDTMLQICYSEKKENTNYAKIKDGFILELYDTKCCLKTLQNVELSNFTLNKEIKKTLKELKTRSVNGYFERIESEISNEELYSTNEEKRFRTYTDAFLNVDTSKQEGGDVLSSKSIYQNAYRVSLINELAVPGIKRMYFIPVSFPGGKQIGHFVLSTTGKLSVLEEQAWIDKFRILSFVLLFPLSQMYLTSIYITKARVESIKATKAAIMSRNMSHNLGSHVMFYIKQRLESVEKILKTGTLEEMIKSHSLDELKQMIENGVTPGEELPFLVGLGRFLNYLQERQDFIATIATNYIPYSTTINFKDAIYDELKPEKHAQRHKGDATGRKAANLLLDYIAYSEGFTSSDDIELGFGDDFTGGNEPKDVPSELREFNVALPGGNLGRQALFSIMENIIRNTAKHDSSKADNGKLKIQFDKLEAENIKDITHYSLRSKENPKKTVIDFDTSCYTKYKNDFYYLGITVKLSEKVSDDTLKSIGKGLSREYLTPDGQMDEECKGLKEIRISSAWLRRQELDDEIPIEEPPAVAIRKTETGHLQYIICLPKPKKIACVVSSKSDIKNLGHVGQEVNLFMDNCIDDTLIKLIANYEIVIVDDAVGTKTFDLLKRNVGARIFWTHIDKITSIDQIYDEWLREAFKTEKKVCMPTISVLDGAGEEKIENINNNENKKIRESGTSERRDEYFKDAIVYIRHYSGQAHPKHKESDRKKFAKAYFIEAVSGGNSTYRLVRQDKRNSEWYAKQIAAGLTKVAIFDERLYGMIMPDGDYEIEDINSCVLSFFNDKALKKLNDNEIWKAFRTKILIKSLHINEDLAFDIYNMELKDKPLHGNVKSKLKFVIDILSKYIHIKNYSKTWQYREAGIWAFNIKTVSGKVIILGYNAPVSKQIGEYKDSYREVELAVIQKDNEKITIKKSDDCPINFKFDFITVHQGILDKIYNTLKIDKSERGKKNREKLTSELSRMFSSNTRRRGDSSSNSFLPQFIIHSGRSKPNVADMPQKQPFLQFSALDHAVRDCKYTLVELLNSAHYE